LLFVSTPPIHAQESPASEKIQGVSPDRKFALRIAFSSTPADLRNIDPNLIAPAELVSMPSKIDRLQIT